MHDTLAPKPPARRSALLWPLVALLSLTACGAEDPEPEPTGDTLRVRYGETWKDFNVDQKATFNPAPAFLSICGTNDPLPEAIDDETVLCINLSLDASVVGTGPTTLTLDGTASVPGGGGRAAVTFEPGPQHTPGVERVWAGTSCFGSAPEETAVHQVTGQLVLEENSATRLKGRLRADVTGTTGGACAGDAAEVDADFDIAR